MRLIVDCALFDVKSAEEALGLADLLITCARNTHNALLTNPPYPPGGDNGPIDTWLNGRSQYEVAAFRRALLNGPLIAAGTRSKALADTGQPRRWNLAGPLEIRVTRRQESDWRNRELTLCDAVDLLREPVHLALENPTDFAFVRYLAGSSNGESLQTFMARPNHFTIHSGGGGEVKRWLEALIEAPSTPATWRRILRTWVLFDSDAGDSDVRELSRSATALISLCEKVISTHGEGLSWICLCRREIESYVPDSGLRAEALAAHKAFVEHVISWRADPNLMSWAWALDLKKGLRGDLRDDLPQDDRRKLKDKQEALKPHMLKAPFTGLSAADISTLEQGLSDRLGEALRANPDRRWVSDLPAEYDRGPAGQAPRVSFVQSLFDRM